MHISVLLQKLLIIIFKILILKKYKENKTFFFFESRSVVSDSLQPHGLYPWNSPGQNTGVGNLSLLIVPFRWTQGHCTPSVHLPVREC